MKKIINWIFSKKNDNKNSFSDIQNRKYQHSFNLLNDEFVDLINSQISDFIDEKVIFHQIIERDRNKSYLYKGNGKWYDVIITNKKIEKILMMNGIDYPELQNVRGVFYTVPEQADKVTLNLILQLYKQLTSLTFLFGFMEFSDNGINQKNFYDSIQNCNIKFLTKRINPQIVKCGVIFYKNKVEEFCEIFNHNIIIGKLENFTQISDVREFYLSFTN